MSQRAPKKVPLTAIPMSKPDRSGPDSSNETLLAIASKRGLLKSEKGAWDMDTDGKPEAPAGRLEESTLWSMSLAMLHFTFDVLAQHQYAEDISWGSLCTRGVQAFVVFLLLFYMLHAHASPSILFPRIPPALHQTIFFASSLATGCYLIHITNEYGYYAVMKQSPPLGCMWIWSIIELDLQWALGSLICCGGFLKYGKYSYL